MTIPVHSDIDQRGVNSLEIAADEPLASYLAYHFAAMSSAFYEHLANAPADPAESQTIDGHRHAHPASGGTQDSEHITRHMRFNLPWIYEQTTSDTSYVDVRMLLLPSCAIFNRSASAEYVYTLRTPFYCTYDADTLTVVVAAHCDVGTTGKVKLSLYAEGDPATPIETDEETVTAVNPDECTLEISIPKTAAYDETRLLIGLEYKAVSGGGDITIESADRWNNAYTATVANEDFLGNTGRLV